MGALWPWIRSEIRQRWRSLVGLALLVVIAGGVAVAAGAGARRTDSAFDRFTTRALARDARVQIEDPALFAPIGAALDQLPWIEASGRVSMAPVAPDPDQVRSDELDLGLFVSPDGSWGTVVDRGVLLRGRRVDPSAVHEVVLNEMATVETGLDVGDRFSVTTFTPDDLEIVFSGDSFPGFNGPGFDLEVVGVTREADELNGSSTSAGPVAAGSPAFLQEYGDAVGTLELGYGVRFAAGERSVAESIAALRAEIRAVAGPDAEVFVVSAAEEFAAGAQKAIDVSAASLFVFAAIAAVAGAVAVTSAISRQLWASRRADDVLAGLGATRRQRRLAHAVPVLGAALLGSVGAGVVAVAASPLFPLRMARAAEPDPGVRFDPAMVVGGSIGIVGLVFAWTAVVLRRADRPGGVVARARSRRHEDLVGTLGLGPASAVGVRHALAPDATSGRVPVRAAMSGGALALAGALSVATIAVSMDALVSEPQRYGWAWSSEPDVVDGGQEAAVAALAEDDRLAAVGVISNAAAEIEGAEVQAVALRQVTGSIEPVLRRGRAPLGPGEAALGAKTMDALDVDIGGTVDAVSSDGEGVHELVVVGEAVFRPVDNPDPASGALLTVEGLEAVRRSDGFVSIALRYPPGADHAALEAALAADHPIDFSVYSAPRTPGNLGNLHATRDVVVAVGAFFAVLGLIGAFHALVVSARNRRHDFAVLRALGFARGEIRRTLGWQAVVMGTVAVAFGIPAGLVAGRLVWRLFVGDLGVLDAPTVPWTVLLVAGPVAMLASALLTSWPYRRIVRSDPSSSLEVR